MRDGVTSARDVCGRFCPSGNVPLADPAEASTAMSNDRLRTAMAKARVTAERLAEAAGVDTKSVRRWLNGTTPHPRHRWAVADVLGLPVAQSGHAR